MAARRLIIVLIVLMLVSTLAAALAPPLTDEEDTTTTTTTTDPAPRELRGELVDARIVADAEDPPTVRVEAGDQLELVVGSRKQLQLEIRPLGLLEVAGPGDPARFSLLLGEPRTLPITKLGDADLLARVRVEPAPKPGKAARKREGDAAQE